MLTHSVMMCKKFAIHSLPLQWLQGKKMVSRKKGGERFNKEFEDWGFPLSQRFKLKSQQHLTVLHVHVTSSSSSSSLLQIRHVTLMAESRWHMQTTCHITCSQLPKMKCWTTNKSSAEFSRNQITGLRFLFLERQIGAMLHMLYENFFVND